MKRSALILLTVCLLLCGCKNGEQVEISHDEIKTLVDLDYTYTNYSHYDSALIRHDQDLYVIKDTHKYCKIIDPKLDTWDEWEELAEGIYSSDLLELRLNELRSMVIDVDGYAYVVPRSQGRPLSVDYECKIIEQNDGRAVAQAIYTDVQEDTFGEEIIYTYEFEHTPSGWRITSVS